MTINHTHHSSDKKSMDSAVARVRGAVQVAGAAVAETMEIKDEAVDEVHKLKTPANTKDNNAALTTISKHAKKVTVRK